jgi:high-affinity nickel-transport protein
MGAVVLALHVAGFVLLLLAVAGTRHRLGATGGFAVGTGVAAYTLGLRHAFDADHIAAIDNTTRKLMSDGQRPLSVGFFFSLGHSTVVFALAGLFALGVRLIGLGTSHGTSLQAVGGWVGTGISGGFLYLIAALNLAVLWSVLRIFRARRTGAVQVAEPPLAGGVMTRICGRFTRAVRRPWQMYPVGVLFGLGFDTATEITLLLLAAGAATSGLPPYAVLCLPLLFAAGMSLLDTIDGSFMNFAYGWAFSNPVRKAFYNLTITGLSVVVALLVGTVELVGLFAEKAGARGAFWTWWEDVDMSTLGLLVAGAFVATWLVALAVWRLGRIEERWRGATGP